MFIISFLSLRECVGYMDLNRTATNSVHRSDGLSVDDETATNSVDCSGEVSKVTDRVVTVLVNQICSCEADCW